MVHVLTQFEAEGLVKGYLGVIDQSNHCESTPQWFINLKLVIAVMDVP